MTQINFFMMAKDEREFLAMLLSRVDTQIFVGGVFDTPSPLHVESARSCSKARVLTLANSVLTPRPVCTVKGAGAISGKFLFDLYRDAHITYDKGFKLRDTLLPGRLFAKIGWLRGPKGEPSPDQNRIYRSWYSSLARWIKKRYARVRDTWWVGPAAFEWSTRGGKLAYGSLNAWTESLKDPKAGGSRSIKVTSIRR